MVNNIKGKKKIKKSLICNWLNLICAYIGDKPIKQYNKKYDEKDVK